MRTTVDLPPDAYHIIRAYANDQKLSLGNAIAELILKGQICPQFGVSDIGFPTFRSKRILTPDLVRELLDDE